MYCIYLQEFIGYDTKHRIMSATTVTEHLNTHVEKHVLNGKIGEDILILNIEVVTLKSYYHGLCS